MRVRSERREPDAPSPVIQALAISETPLSWCKLSAIIMGLYIWRQNFEGGARTMPKMKTHKATKKRFRVTATGKVKHRSAGTSHLATRKTQKQKRNLRGTTTVMPVEEARIRRALGKYSY